MKHHEFVRAGNTPHDRQTIAIIGAGPVGLVAAAHLLARGLRPVVLEAGDSVGWSMRRWSHVRLFSPWRYLIDETAADLLGPGWTRPPPDEIPTGGELVERFVEPLGNALADYVRLGTRVTAVARWGLDVMKTPGREDAAYEFRFKLPDGMESSLRAHAVIDASGTYEHPNPLGANGLPALGEGQAEAAGRLHYGVPDVRGVDVHDYVGRRIAVVGSGHTAFNALLALDSAGGNASSGETPHRTEVTWILRGRLRSTLHGNGEADALSERGQLEVSVRQAAAAGRFSAVEGFRIGSVSVGSDGVTLADADGLVVGPFDRVVVATGYRPDLGLTRELRLDLDPAVEAPRALAPLIDPNVHSCGTVPPHGYGELSHPEPNFFTVGMKSYGRAPTFLLLTGYEQVRSVASYLAGDLDGAKAVMLELPETGVCVTDLPVDEAAPGDERCEQDDHERNCRSIRDAI